MGGLGLDDKEMDLVVLEDGEVVRTHGPARCTGTPCPVHGPSRHLLSEAPLSWLPELQLMMRRCPHGQVHPDPDSMAYLVERLLAYGSWHECCAHRCCANPSAPVRVAGSTCAPR
jgi:hypothetical protein